MSVPKRSPREKCPPSSLCIIKRRNYNNERPSQCLKSLAFLWTGQSSHNVLPVAHWHRVWWLGIKATVGQCTVWGAELQASFEFVSEGSDTMIHWSVSVLKAENHYWPVCFRYDRRKLLLVDLFFVVTAKNLWLVSSLSFRPLKGIICGDTFISTAKAENYFRSICFYFDNGHLLLVDFLSHWQQKTVNGWFAFARPEVVLCGGKTLNPVTVSTAEKYTRLFDLYTK